MGDKVKGENYIGKEEWEVLNCIEYLLNCFYRNFGFCFLLIGDGRVFYLEGVLRGFSKIINIVFCLIVLKFMIFLLFGNIEELYYKNIC